MGTLVTGAFSALPAQSQRDRRESGRDSRWTSKVQADPVVDDRARARVPARVGASHTKVR